MDSVLALLTSLALAASPLSEVCRRPCDFSETGINVVQHFEGYSPFVYDDAAGLPTIGYGHLIVAGEKFEEPMMQDDAQALLRRDTARTVAGVNRVVKVRLRQGQFDALSCFSFNLGTGALGKSTLLRRVNAERHDAVPPEFMKWVYAGGKRLRGLEVRRRAEAEIYRKSGD